MDRSILTKKHGEMTQAERDALVSRYESHSACLSPPYGMRCECNSRAAMAVLNAGRFAGSGVGRVQKRHSYQCAVTSRIAIQTTEPV
jgi:hypothetical protein